MFMLPMMSVLRRMMVAHFKIYQDSICFSLDFLLLVFLLLYSVFLVLSRDM